MLGFFVYVLYLVRFGFTVLVLGQHCATELHPSPMVPVSHVQKLKHGQEPG